MKRYVYILKEEALYEILAENPRPLEILRREGDTVRFAVYEPLKGLKPEKVEEVKEFLNVDNFEPVVVEDFVIVPPWKEVIKIKPGMAFGTGLHPTTQMCVIALKRFLKRGESLLDVGTGSGILAIAGKRLGADKVLAIDVSEEAIKECRENAESNEVTVDCVLADVCQVEESFDVVVANLEIETFRSKIDCILKLTGKKLILSGLYGREEKEEMINMLRDLELIEVIEKEGWYTIVLRRGAC